MTRRVFFSFEYSDVTRAMVVRNSWVTKGREAAGFVDAAEFEKVEKQGEKVIKAWIDEQLKGTSVTCVLVGANTCSSKWVQYEIDASVAKGNGVFGVDISKIAGFDKSTTDCCGPFPKGHTFYRWFKDEGSENLGSWIELAAK